MVTDRQMRRLMSLLQDGQSQQVSADKAEMDRGTARKYRKLGQLPSALRTEHDWRTRVDPFIAVYAYRDGGLEAVSHAGPDASVHVRSSLVQNAAL